MKAPIEILGVPKLETCQACHYILHTSLTSIRTFVQLSIDIYIYINQRYNTYTYMHIAFNICYIAFQLDQRYMVTTLHRSPTKIMRHTLPETNKSGPEKRCFGRLGNLGMAQPGRVYVSFRETNSSQTKKT